MTAPLEHSPRCPKPAPVLRLSWQQEPEIFCSDCGRATPAPDQRHTTTPQETK